MEGSESGREMEQTCCSVVKITGVNLFGRPGADICITAVKVIVV